MGQERIVTPYYSDDTVTIYHGDCRDILPTLGVSDLVVTDPPYMIGSMSASRSRTARSTISGAVKQGHKNQMGTPPKNPNGS